MTYHQSGANMNFKRKPTLRLCSDSPRISAFERQLSLIKTPVVMQNGNSPTLIRGNLKSVSYSAADDSSPNESLSNLSDATLIGSGNNQLKQINSLKRDQSDEHIKAVNTTPTSLKAKANSKPVSLNFRIPIKEIIHIKNELEIFVNSIIETLNSITKKDVDLFLDHLSEFIIGVFVVFSAEILCFNKEAFLTLVQMVVACVIRFGLKNGGNDSLLLQSSVISVFENSNLPVHIKRSITHLITTLQFYILFSTFRVTFIFKKNYMDEYSKIDSLSIMGLGVVMVLLCLNLITNSLPASHHYSEVDEVESVP